MGVRGLWKVLEPTARPVLLESLRGKALAIDASIWVYHFLKAMRDPAGVLIPAAHIIGFFRRICKLIFYEIRPVFVFDGAAPQLKKQTTARRQERRVNRTQSARAAANKLLTLHLQKHAEEMSARENNLPPPKATVTGSIPSNAVYLGDLQGSPKKPQPSTSFQKEDQYHLPDVENIAPIRMDDQRLLTEEELDEYAQKFTDQARMGFIDMHTVDFHSPEFKRLPLTTQYQLLNAARLKSRLRMGYTADQLDKMFPSRMEFSRFQIDRVAQRNFFTQRLMDLVGMEEDLTHRVSSEKNTEYMLKRNEQGWTLSLEEKSRPKEESDDEFEEVDIAPTAPEQPTAREEFDAKESKAEEMKTKEPKAEVVEDRHTDVSSEAAAKSVEALFGYEENLKRQTLYDSMDDNTAPTRAAPGQSMLFSSPGTSMLFHEPKKQPKPTLKAVQEEVIEAEKPEPKEDEEPVEQPPWFDPGERTDFGAVEGRREEPVSGLMSYEEARRLEREFSSDEELEPVDIVAKPQPEPTEVAKVQESSETAEQPAEIQEAIASIEHEDAATLDETRDINEAIIASLNDTNEQIETRELKPEEKELADEEERDDEEAAEDLAEMFIGETREHERFEKNLAKQQWTGSDYAAELKNLKGQYAKSTRDADAPTEEMIQECQELLQLFGVPYITAPCEAEAQCAELEKLKLVDGIVTDDGDAFLFSSKVVVYRNMFSQAKYAEVYKSTTIDADLGLSQDKLVELAMLLGSDYTDGLPGIGPVTGVEILAEFDSLKAFKEWWVDAQRFPDQADTSTPLRRRLVKQLKSKLFLPEDFPSHAVRDAYVHPAVDHDATAFQWGAPDLDGLRAFLGRVAGWTPEKVNDVLVPVLQEAKRQDLHRKAEKYTTQSSLDDYYSTVRELNLGSKRAAKATSQLKKRKH